MLTATPEQAGLDSHFARLRLLDPDRFHNLEAFQKEQAGHAQLNSLIQQLLETEHLNTDQQQQLKQYLGESCSGTRFPK